MDEDDSLVQLGAKRGAALAVEAAHRRGEHHPFVDFGLELELELGRLAIDPRAFGDVHEVADPLDDLAERVERGRGVCGRGEGGELQAHLDVPASPPQEQRHASALVAGRDEVLDVGDAVDAVDALEPRLDARGDGPLAAQEAGALVRGCRAAAAQCSPPGEPRVGITPRDASAPASRSLPVLSQRS